MYRSPIAMPAKGVDLLTPDTGMKPGTARMVMNCDIHRDGTISRRAGRTKLAGGHDFHSIRETALGLLVGKGPFLCLMNPETGVPLVLGQLDDAGLFDFTEYNGKVYVLTRTQVYSLEYGEPPKPCGVQLPATLPDIAAIATGGLPAGRYAIGITKASPTGEESPAAILGSVELPDGGGIQLTGIEPDLDAEYRVYLTAPDGQVMRLAESFHGSFSQYLVTRYPDGAQCATRNLKPLPGGHFIRGYKGRLLIAQGDILWHSEAMRQHLHDPSSGFTRFTGQIRMVEPTETGVYVGDDAGVWYLQGEDITKAGLRKVSSAKVIAGSALKVPGSVARRTEIVGDVVIWLSTEGYIMATNTGEVMALHAGQIRIDPDLTGTSALILKDGAARMMTMTGAGSAFGFGLANRSDNDA